MSSALIGTAMAVANAYSQHQWRLIYEASKQAKAHDECVGREFRYSHNLISSYWQHRKENS